MTRRTLTRLILPGLLIASMFTSRPATGEDSVDLYSLVLIAADLFDAKKQMTVHDPNEDGFIDAGEQQSLTWKKDRSKFDLNKDGKLTHLELAIRQASLRYESDSTQTDRNNARKWMRRKDGNGNGQLDPAEIAKGWPEDPEEYDSDENGTITMDELVAQLAVRRRMRREMGIEGIDHSEAIRTRDRFDSDKDGKLAADEWAKASLPESGKEFDEDGDNFLSVAEIATLLAKHRIDLGLTVSDQTKIRQLFILDFNRDGKISKTESTQGVFGGQPKDLSIFDENKDGDITMSELEKFFAAQRKERGYNASHFTVAQRLLLRNDKNRSKYLEEHEFAEVPGPGQLPADRFDSIDRNKDQRVGLDEISRYLAAEEK